MPQALVSLQELASSGTPRGLPTGQVAPTKPLMDSVSGHAQGAAALLATCIRYTPKCPTAVSWSIPGCHDSLPALPCFLAGSWGPRRPSIHQLQLSTFHVSLRAQPHPGRRRLPLGIPSRIIMQALDLARALILKPEPTTAPGQAVCREAGYVILGSLRWALPATALRVSSAAFACRCWTIPNGTPQHEHMLACLWCISMM